VIGEEVEKALRHTMQHFPEVSVAEFTVAPKISSNEAEPSFHEWLIEFDQKPTDLPVFERTLNTELCKLNSYYDDLIKGHILQNLKVTALPPAAFQKYMHSQGKLGGQNKVPRLSNDRNLADGLLNLKI